MATQKIPFLNIKAINERYRNEFHHALDQILDSGQVLLGKQTTDFESDYANFCNTKYAVGIANGLEALYLVLKAWGIGPGDEVIVPSNTYIATWLAVTHTGATIVPVEPRLDTYNIDVGLIENSITSKTKAIIPVHLYGQMAEMDHILSLAKKYGLKILEDSSQAHGASYKNIVAGNWGHASATSLYPGKNLGALGDAGIITTNDDNLYEKIKKLRNYGSHVRYAHEYVGYNSRLDEIQAAFLKIKLCHLPQENARRSHIAQTYLDQLKTTELILPSINLDCKHAWHLFTIRHQKRTEIMQHLSSQGIECLVHYPTPPHLQKAYSFLNYSAGSFPISEKIHETIFSIPIDPTLTDDQVNYIIEKLTNFF